jgi:hypothetical protein
MGRSIQEAFHYRGCPICHLIDKEEFDFMAQLQHQVIEDEKVRQRLVSSKAYCNSHFYEMARLTSPVVNAVLTKDLIKEEIRVLEEKTSGITNEVDCSVCKHVMERERFYLEEFKALLREESFQKEYDRTDGLCRIHLKRVLDSLKGGELCQYLLRTHLTHLKLLGMELETFISKIRSTKRDIGTEKNSWLVAIEKWVGKKGLRIRPR